MTDALATIASLSDMRPHLAKAESPVALVIEPGDHSFCGQVIDGVFGYRYGVETPGLGVILRDFRTYESAHGRTPLVFRRSDAADVPFTPAVAPPVWVVHSTDAEAGAAILAEGELSSALCLRRRGATYRAFGRETLGEPSDYADLINFGTPNSTGPEIVVASKQHDRFCTEDDTYTPGVRFYVEVDSLRRARGYTPFLGGHTVRGALRLSNVRHATVSAADLPAPPVWTPRTFTEAANQRFRIPHSD